MGKSSGADSMQPFQRLRSPKNALTALLSHLIFIRSRIIRSSGFQPRFILKWMPFYRSTELENGLTQQDLTVFGTVPFSPELGMFFEVPVAQYRDLSDIPGIPSGTDAIGIGDIDLKFLWNPKALGFNYGKDGKKSGAWLFKRKNGRKA